MTLPRLALLLSVCILPCCSGCDSPASNATTANTAALTSDSVISRGNGRYRDVTFDDIKFEMEKTEPFLDSMLTENIHELFGQKIRIYGYMYPTLRKRGLRQFVLVRDNMECCFGPGAALFDCILVYMEPGKTAEYSYRPVAVEGKFSMEKFRDPEGVVRAIYRLDGEKVEQ